MVRDRLHLLTHIASRRTNSSAVWSGPKHGFALSCDGSPVAFVANRAEGVAAGTAREYPVFCRAAALSGAVKMARPDARRANAEITGTAR